MRKRQIYCFEMNLINDDVVIWVYCRIYFRVCIHMYTCVAVKRIIFEIDLGCL